jgi:hypothetical protein
VFDHGVAHDQADIRWKRDGLVSERAAVEKNYVIGLAEAGDELVHDSDMRADEFIFGSLAEFGDF